MNKNMMLVLGAVVLVAIGAFIYYAQANEAWTEDWLPQGQSNQGITGKWYIEPYLIYSDGSREPLNRGFEALWVESPDGNQVITIEYIIKAQATRDEHVGTFDSVEIDISNLKLNADFVPTYDPFACMSVWEEFTGSVTIPFTSGTQTDIVQVAKFTIPVDVTGSADHNGIPLSSLPCSTMNAMTENWQTGAYMTEYSAQGSIQFRGKNAEYGDGEWVQANLPSSVAHGLTIGGNEVSMDWSTDVIYN